MSQKGDLQDRFRPIKPSPIRTEEKSKVSTDDEDKPKPKLIPTRNPQVRPHTRRPMVKACSTDEECSIRESTPSPNRVSKLRVPRGSSLGPRPESQSRTNLMAQSYPPDSPRGTRGSRVHPRGMRTRANQVSPSDDRAVKQPSIRKSPRVRGTACKVKQEEEKEPPDIDSNKDKNREKMKVKSGAKSEGCSDVESTTTEDEEDEKIVERSESGKYIKYSTIIGKGAFKNVYKGCDTTTGEPIAWCELQNTKKGEERERFKAEAEILKGLNHANIVRYYDYWETKGTVVLVTEMMNSGTLKTFLKNLNQIKPKVLKKYSRQILRGLNYLHTQKPPIVHRDLKCDNIFINGADASVKIGDLGLATFRVRSTVKSVIGTPEFMAPEMYEESYNEKVDVYSFGMCLIEMATMEYPYLECAGPMQILRKVTRGDPPDCLQKVEDPELKDIILWCVQPNPVERPTVSDVLSHPFFLEDPEKDPGFSLEVQNKEDAIDPKNNIVHFQLKVMDNNKKGPGYPDELAIAFPFDVEIDTVPKVVDSMVSFHYITQKAAEIVKRHMELRLSVIRCLKMDRLRRGVVPDDKGPVLLMQQLTNKQIPANLVLEPAPKDPRVAPRKGDPNFKGNIQPLQTVKEEPPRLNQQLLSPLDAPIQTPFQTGMNEGRPEFQPNIPQCFPLQASHMPNIEKDFSRPLMVETNPSIVQGNIANPAGFQPPYDEMRNLITGAQGGPPTMQPQVEQDRRPVPDSFYQQNFAQPQSEAQPNVLDQSQYYQVFQPQGQQQNPTNLPPRRQSIELEAPNMFPGQQMPVNSSVQESQDVAIDERQAHLNVQGMPQQAMSANHMNVSEQAAQFPHLNFGCPETAQDVRQMQTYGNIPTQYPPPMATYPDQQVQQQPTQTVQLGGVQQLGIPQHPYQQTVDVRADKVNGSQAARQFPVAPTPPQQQGQIGFENLMNQTAQELKEEQRVFDEHSQNVVAQPVQVIAANAQFECQTSYQNMQQTGGVHQYGTSHDGHQQYSVPVDTSRTEPTLQHSMPSGSDLKQLAQTASTPLVSQPQGDRTFQNQEGRTSSGQHAEYQPTNLTYSQVVQQRTQDSTGYPLDGLQRGNQPEMMSQNQTLLVQVAPTKSVDPHQQVGSFLPQQVSNPILQQTNIAHQGPEQQRQRNIDTEKPGVQQVSASNAPILAAPQYQQTIGSLQLNNESSSQQQIPNVFYQTQQLMSSQAGPLNPVMPQPWNPENHASAALFAAQMQQQYPIGTASSSVVQVSQNRPAIPQQQVQERYSVTDVTAQPRTSDNVSQQSSQPKAPAQPIVQQQTLPQPQIEQRHQQYVPSNQNFQQQPSVPASQQAANMSMAQQTGHLQPMPVQPCHQNTNQPVQTVNQQLHSKQQDTLGQQMPQPPAQQMSGQQFQKPQVQASQSQQLPVHQGLPPNVDAPKQEYQFQQQFVQGYYQEQHQQPPSQVQQGSHQVSSQQVSHLGMDKNNLQEGQLFRHQQGDMLQERINPANQHLQTGSSSQQLSPNLQQQQYQQAQSVPAQPALHLQQVSETELLKRQEYQSIQQQGSQQAQQFTQQQQQLGMQPPFKPPTQSEHARQQDGQIYQQQYLHQMYQQTGQYPQQQGNIGNQLPSQQNLDQMRQLGGSLVQQQHAQLQHTLMATQQQQFQTQVVSGLQQAQQPEQVRKQEVAHTNQQQACVFTQNQQQVQQLHQPQSLLAHQIPNIQQTTSQQSHQLKVDVPNQGEGKSAQYQHAAVAFQQPQQLPQQRVQTSQQGGQFSGNEQSQMQMHQFAQLQNQEVQVKQNQMQHVQSQQYMQMPLDQNLQQQGNQAEQQSRAHQFDRVTREQPREYPQQGQVHEKQSHGLQQNQDQQEYGDQQPGQKVLQPSLSQQSLQQLHMQQVAQQQAQNRQDSMRQTHVMTAQQQQQVQQQSAFQQQIQSLMSQQSAQQGMPHQPEQFQAQQAQQQTEIQHPLPPHQQTVQMQEQMASQSLCGVPQQPQQKPKQVVETHETQPMMKAADAVSLQYSEQQTRLLSQNTQMSNDAAQQASSIHHLQLKAQQQVLQTQQPAADQSLHHPTHQPLAHGIEPFHQTGHVSQPYYLPVQSTGGFMPQAQPLQLKPEGASVQQQPAPLEANTSANLQHGLQQDQNFHLQHFQQQLYQVTQQSIQGKATSPENANQQLTLQQLLQMQSQSGQQQVVQTHAQQFRAPTQAAAELQFQQQSQKKPSQAVMERQQQVQQMVSGEAGYPVQMQQQQHYYVQPPSQELTQLQHSAASDSSIQQLPQRLPSQQYHQTQQPQFQQMPQSGQQSNLQQQQPAFSQQGVQFVQQQHQQAVGNQPQKPLASQPQAMHSDPQLSSEMNQLVGQLLQTSLAQIQHAQLPLMSGADAKMKSQPYVEPSNIVRMDHAVAPTEALAVQQAQQQVQQGFPASAFYCQEGQPKQHPVPVSSVSSSTSDTLPGAASSATHGRTTDQVDSRPVLEQMPFNQQNVPVFQQYAVPSSQVAGGDRIVYQHEQMQQFHYMNQTNNSQPNLVQLHADAASIHQPSSAPVGNYPGLSATQGAAGMDSSPVETLRGVVPDPTSQAMQYPIVNMISSTPPRMPQSQHLTLPVGARPANTPIASAEGSPYNTAVHDVVTTPTGEPSQRIGRVDGVTALPPQGPQMSEPKAAERVVQGQSNHPLQDSLASLMTRPSTPDTHESMDSCGEAAEHAETGRPRRTTRSRRGGGRSPMLTVLSIEGPVVECQLDVSKKKIVNFKFDREAEIDVPSIANTLVSKNLMTSQHVSNFIDLMNELLTKLAAEPDKIPVLEGAATKKREETSASPSRNRTSLSSHSRPPLPRRAESVETPLSGPCSPSLSALSSLVQSPQSTLTDKPSVVDFRSRSDESKQSGGSSPLPPITPALVVPSDSSSNSSLTVETPKVRKISRFLVKTVPDPLVTAPPTPLVTPDSGKKDDPSLDVPQSHPPTLDEKAPSTPPEDLQKETSLSVQMDTNLMFPTGEGKGEGKETKAQVMTFGDVPPFALPGCSCIEPTRNIAGVTVLDGGIGGLHGDEYSSYVNSRDSGFAEMNKIQILEVTTRNLSDVLESETTVSISEDESTPHSALQTLDTEVSSPDGPALDPIAERAWEGDPDVLFAPVRRPSKPQKSASLSHPLDPRSLSQELEKLKRPSSLPMSPADEGVAFPGSALARFRSHERLPARLSDAEVQTEGDRVERKKSRFRVNAVSEERELNQNGRKISANTTLNVIMCEVYGEVQTSIDEKDPRIQEVLRRHMEERAAFFERQRQELQSLVRTDQSQSSEISTLSSTTVGDSPETLEDSPERIHHHLLDRSFSETPSSNQSNTWHGDQTGGSPSLRRHLERLQGDSQSSSAGTSPTNQKRKVFDEDFLKLVNTLTSSRTPSTNNLVRPSLNQLRSGAIPMPRVNGSCSPSKEGPSSLK